MAFDFLDNKCGEIYSQNKSQISIVCTLCEFKVFDFNDFLRHLHYVHSYEEHIKLSSDEQLADDIKTEKDEENGGEDGKEFQECQPIEQEYLIDELTEETLAFSDGELEEDRISISNSRHNREKSKKQKDARTASASEESDEEDDDENEKDEDFEIEDKPKRRKRIKYKRDEPTDFQCDICKKYYFSAVTLRVHKRSQHSKGATGDESKAATSEEKCTVCGLEFQDKKTINSHYITEHGGFVCTTCGKKFKDKYDQRRHMEIHSETKNYVCDWENCGKRFITIRYLRTHLKIHLNKKDFVCDVCGYACRTPDMLRLHYRRHTGEKPYPCPQCGKRFASSSAVKEHQASHIQDRPHVCDVCGSSFGRAKSLYHHKHLHSGKKFKCKVCDKPFAQLAGLSMHMKKHKEESGII